MKQFYDGTTPEATGPGGLTHVTMLIKDTSIGPDGRFSFYCRPPYTLFSLYGGSLADGVFNELHGSEPHRIDVSAPVNGGCVFVCECPKCRMTYQILIYEGG